MNNVHPFPSGGSNQGPSFGSQHVRAMTRVRELPHLLKIFASNPIGTMKIPMRLTWPASLSLQIGFALVAGAISGLVARNFWDFLAGLILFPLTSLVVGFVFTGFFFSFFSLFRSTYLDFHRLHSIVVLSLIPYLLLHIFSGFIPPMDLLGFALTAALLIVGLVEQFGLQRKIVLSLVGALTALYCIAWTIAQIRLTANVIDATHFKAGKTSQEERQRLPASVPEKSRNENLEPNSRDANP